MAKLEIDVTSLPYRRDAEGRVLNELGTPAKGRQVVYRDERTGYVLVRFCDLGEKIKVVS